MLGAARTVLRALGHLLATEMPIDFIPQARLLVAKGGKMMLEAAAFMLDLLHCPDPELTEEGNRRAPALQRMLQEKALHYKRQQQPAAIFDQTEC